MARWSVGLVGVPDQLLAVNLALMGDYFAKFKPQEILKDNFPDTILDYYKTTFDLKDFFTEALAK